jgi:diketogulonate reductase-like aldo/keto reductase
MIFPSALAQGTWHLGQGRHPRAVELAALRRGLELGLDVIDTAEAYGDGAAERLVARAIAGSRDDVFLVSKVLPHHATTAGTVAACEASLARLGTDHLDLYLLHWRGRVPLTETLAGFAILRRRGLIDHWGVSNFPVAGMAKLVVTPGGAEVATDQVLFNLAHRGVEYDLLPWCEERGIPLMAYSPLERGRLLEHPTVREIAARHGATAAQVAIGWIIEHEQVVAIAEAGTPEHVEENRGALDLHLTAVDLADLVEAFPPPLGPVPLEVD